MNKLDINLSGSKILLVDDQSENLAVLSGILEPHGYRIIVCNNGNTALDLAGRLSPDLILLDVSMPGMDGFETCKRLKDSENTQDIPVIFLTARVETDDVITGFEAGGVDYITKPFKEAELIVRVNTQLRLNRLFVELVDKNEALEAEMTQRKKVTEERDVLNERLSLISDDEMERWGISGFVGQSQTLKQILADIARLQQATTSVLVTGESGTGKELIARAVHFGSNRANGPFVPVNCSAIPHELADSLCFGHVKGAFTGADKDRKGYFELAQGGTIFLDEIGDMPLDLQAKLLRVLEDRKVLPVGAAKERDIDVRVVAATNVNIEAQVKEGTFRQDLYYRLAGFPVKVPPLRERKEDIPLLTQHFLNVFAREMGLSSLSCSDDALAALTEHDFPGNIRELKNVIERALLLSNGRDIASQHLQLDSEASVAPVGESASGSPTMSKDELPLDLRAAELAVIEKAMSISDGNVTEAARLLGVHRMKIYRRLEKLE